MDLPSMSISKSDLDKGIPQNLSIQSTQTSGMYGGLEALAAQPQNTQDQQPVQQGLPTQGINTQDVVNLTAQEIAMDSYEKLKNKEQQLVNSYMQQGYEQGYIQGVNDYDSTLEQIHNGNPPSLQSTDSSINPVQISHLRDYVDMKLSNGDYSVEDLQDILNNPYTTEDQKRFAQNILQQLGS